MPTEIDVELLRQRFIYDPETGALAHRNMIFDQYGFSPRHGGRDKEVA